MIKMSVVVPTHGRVNLFKETLQCLACQTSKEFEIIITDDSNLEEERNEIKEVISNFQNKDINIKYIFTEPNLYQAKNTNQGLKAASGKYIRILHSDDIIVNNCIEKEIEYFEKNEDIDIFYHHFTEFSDIRDAVLNNKEANLEIINAKIWLEKTIFTNTIIPSCLLFRKSILEKVGGMYEDYKFLCDWKLFFDFLIVSYKENKRLGHIIGNFVYYRFSNDNITSSLIFNHFFEHKDFIERISKIYEEENIISKKSLLYNIYNATKYRFDRLKKDIKTKNDNRIYLKYISILLSQKYSWFHIFFTIILFPLKVVKEILEFFSLADVYKERLKRSFIRFWK